jgi:hypothetical protein
LKEDEFLSELTFKDKIKNLLRFFWRKIPVSVFSIKLTIVDDEEDGGEPYNSSSSSSEADVDPFDMRVFQNPITVI